MPAPWRPIATAPCPGDSAGSPPCSCTAAGTTSWATCCSWPSSARTSRTPSDRSGTSCSTSIFLGAWFLYQLIEANFGLFNAHANGGGVAFFAHVGGFIFGLLVTLLLEQAGRIGSHDRSPPLQAPA